jgi:hypothetical protein
MLCSMRLVDEPHEAPMKRMERLCVMAIAEARGRNGLKCRWFCFDIGSWNVTFSLLDTASNGYRAFSN